MTDKQRVESTPHGGVHRLSLLDAPELPVVIFSFLLHFVWEFVQAPTYPGMAEMNHWDGIKLCMSATFGDAGFALGLSLCARPVLVIG